MAARGTRAQVHRADRHLDFLAWQPGHGVRPTTACSRLRAELWCGPVWGTDLLNAMDHLDASGGGAMLPVKREAERLVRRNWDAIERVAETLSALVARVAGEPVLGTRTGEGDERRAVELARGAG